MSRWFDDEAMKCRVILGPEWDGVEAAVVLGSGLAAGLDGLTVEASRSFQDLPGLGACAVPGHVGKLILGTLSGKRVIGFVGRRHYYEGVTMAGAGFPARLASTLGARTLISFSAMGAIERNLAVGDWLFVTDHVNLMGLNPLHGVVTPDGPPFVDLSAVYRADLLEPLQDALKGRAKLSGGTVAAFCGPTYETPAEIAMAGGIGCAAATMSLVPEAVWARFLGLDVVAFGRVTNLGAGLSDAGLDHAEVLSHAAEASTEAALILEELLRLRV